jgi:hypothetical protein
MIAALDTSDICWDFNLPLRQAAAELWQDISIEEAEGLNDSEDLQSHSAEFEFEPVDFWPALVEHEQRRIIRQEANIIRPKTA